MQHFINPNSIENFTENSQSTQRFSVTITAAKVYLFLRKAYPDPQDLYQGIKSWLMPSEAGITESDYKTSKEKMHRLIRRFLDSESSVMGVGSKRLESSAENFMASLQNTTESTTLHRAVALISNSNYIQRNTKEHKGSQNSSAALLETKLEALDTVARLLVEAEDSDAYERNLSNFLRAYSIIENIEGKQKNMEGIEELMVDCFDDLKLATPGLDILANVAEDLLENFQRVLAILKNISGRKVFVREFFAILNNNLTSIDRGKYFSQLASMQEYLRVNDDTLAYWCNNDITDESTLELSPYQINRIIFHAWILSPQDWTENYVKVLNSIVNLIIKAKYSTESVLEEFQKNIPMQLLVNLRLLIKIRLTDDLDKEDKIALYKVIFSQGEVYGDISQVGDKFCRGDFFKDALMSRHWLKISKLFTDSLELMISPHSLLDIICETDSSDKEKLRQLLSCLTPMISNLSSSELGRLCCLEKLTFLNNTILSALTGKVPSLISDHNALWKLLNTSIFNQEQWNRIFEELDLKKLMLKSKHFHDFLAHEKVPAELVLRVLQSIRPGELRYNLYEKINIYYFINLLNSEKIRLSGLRSKLWAWIKNQLSFLTNSPIELQNLLKNNVWDVSEQKDIWTVIIQWLSKKSLTVIELWNMRGGFTASQYQEIWQAIKPELSRLLAEERFGFEKFSYDIFIWIITKFNLGRDQLKILFDNVNFVSARGFLSQIIKQENIPIDLVFDVLDSIQPGQLKFNSNTQFFLDLLNPKDKRFTDYRSKLWIWSKSQLALAIWNPSELKEVLEHSHLTDAEKEELWDILVQRILEICRSPNLFLGFIKEIDLTSSQLQQVWQVISPNINVLLTDGTNNYEMFTMFVTNFGLDEDQLGELFRSVYFNEPVYFQQNQFCKEYLLTIDFNKFKQILSYDCVTEQLATILLNKFKKYLITSNSHRKDYELLLECRKFSDLQLCQTFWKFAPTVSEGQDSFINPESWPQPYQRQIAIYAISWVGFHTQNIPFLKEHYDDDARQKVAEIYFNLIFSKGHLDNNQFELAVDLKDFLRERLLAEGSKKDLQDALNPQSQFGRIFSYHRKIKFLSGVLFFDRGQPNSIQIIENALNLKDNFDGERYTPAA